MKTRHLVAAIAAVLGLTTWASAQVADEGLRSSVVPNYLKSTFAALPTASGNTGRIFNVTDVGTPGSLWQSNGTDWKPLGKMKVCGSNTPVSDTSSTNGAETNKASCAIAAGLPQTTNSLEIEVTTEFTGSTNSKSILVRYETSCGVTTGDAYLNAATTTNTNLSFRGQAILRFTAANAQRAVSANNQNGAMGTFSTGSPVTGTKNSANATCLNFNINKALGTETYTIDSYTVYVAP